MFGTFLPIDGEGFSDGAPEAWLLKTCKYMINFWVLCLQKGLDIIQQPKIGPCIIIGFHKVLS